jgi:hypothetical protein
MALYVCRNINEDFSVIIKKLLSNKYLLCMFCLTKWLIPTILSQFKKYLISFSKVDIKHKFFIVKLHKLILKKLIWSSWQEMLRILQYNADALHSGRFSTAWHWIGPSLDWRTPKSKITAFLWCNSLYMTYLSFPFHLNDHGQALKWPLIFLDEGE